MSLPLHERATLVRERLSSGSPAYACPADLDPVRVIGELLSENQTLREQLNDKPVTEVVRGLREEAEGHPASPPPTLHKVPQVSRRET